jgi:hypothetical protein
MKRDSRLDLLERNLFVTPRFTSRHLTRHVKGECIGSGSASGRGRCRGRWMQSDSWRAYNDH